jgi:thioredoxin reductase (NADPH)
MKRGNTSGAAIVGTLWRPRIDREPVFSTTIREHTESMNDVRDVIVIGGGPAGYTAALYAARANLEPLVIEGFNWGGQLMITSDVENYPGYADGVMGPAMMQDFRRQAERFGASFVTDDVTRVDFSQRPFRIWVGDDEYRAESVIVATGASARQLGLPSEQVLQGRGVSYCATCDAAFFRDKVVVVVGGGDSAMEEALFISRFASKVIVVHRREEFRASPIMVDRARSSEKIEFVLNKVVTEVLGDGKVTGIRLVDTVTGEESVLDADGVFVAIGHDPNTALFLDQLDHEPDTGYLVTRGKSTETNIPGVFAAGDVQDHTYRQAVTAAGSGCAAALDAERWLSEQRHAALSAAATTA